MHTALEDTKLAEDLVHHTVEWKMTLDTIRIACANAETDLAAQLALHLPRAAEAKKTLAKTSSPLQATSAWGSAPSMSVFSRRGPNPSTRRSPRSSPPSTNGSSPCPAISGPAGSASGHPQFHETACTKSV